MAVTTPGSLLVLINARAPLVEAHRPESGALSRPRLEATRRTASRYQLRIDRKIDGAAIRPSGTYGETIFGDEDALGLGGVPSEMPGEVPRRAIRLGNRLISVVTRVISIVVLFLRGIIPNGGGRGTSIPLAPAEGELASRFGYGIAHRTERATADPVRTALRISMKRVGWMTVDRRDHSLITRQPASITGEPGRSYQLEE